MRGLVAATHARVVVSDQSATHRAVLGFRVAWGVLPAARTDSDSKLCVTWHVRRTCISAAKSTFWHATSRHEALAVSSSAPHARTARWGYPTRRSDSQRGAQRTVREARCGVAHMHDCISLVAAAASPPLLIKGATGHRGDACTQRCARRDGQPRQERGGSRQRPWIFISRHLSTAQL